MFHWPNIQSLKITFNAIKIFFFIKGAKDIFNSAKFTGNLKDT